MPQAIVTRYRGPRNTAGARITARAWGGRVSIPYPHEAHAEAKHRIAAEALCKRMGWPADDLLDGGVLPDGETRVFVFASEAQPKASA
jgi:hypothetical protein